MVSKIREKGFSKIFEQVNSKDKILDIGCGGTNSKGSEHYGVDCSFESLPKNGKMCVAVAERLPFKDCSFDVCIMSQIIEHLLDGKAAVLEAFRALKKGRTIHIATPVPHADPLLQILSKLKVIGKFEHICYWTGDGLIKLLKLCGFKKIKIEYYNFGLDILILGQK